MDWQEALEIVVGRTGREFYRVACSEDRRDHLAWRAEMIRQATGQPQAPPTTLHAVPPIMNIDPWLLKIRGCPHFSPGCCNHPAPFCDLYQLNPTREQCIECLGGSIE